LSHSHGKEMGGADIFLEQLDDKSDNIELIELENTLAESLHNMFLIYHKLNAAISFEVEK